MRRPKVLDLTAALWEGQEISPLALTNDAAARLTRPQREARLDDLILDSRRIVDDAIETHVYGADRKLAGVIVLFSGGNDSTVCAHLFRDMATHAGHANTTVGIESTRQYVRDTCASWGLPLLERTPPRIQDHYRSLVLSTEVDKKANPLGGFPGPGMHWKMWNRLKERSVQAMQQDILCGRGRTHRVVLIAGRRRDESARRSTIPQMQTRRSRVWAAPLLNWTKIDLNTYRLRHPEIPVNETASILHMSGECLCGSYASPGERGELDYWFAEDMEFISALEAQLLRPEFDLIPIWRKTWGWGAIPELAEMARRAAPGEMRPKTAGLCSSCDQLALWGAS